MSRPMVSPPEAVELAHARDRAADSLENASLINRVRANIGSFTVHNFEQGLRDGKNIVPGTVQGGLIFATAPDGIHVVMETDPSVLSTDVDAGELLQRACEKEFYDRIAESVSEFMTQFGSEAELAVRTEMRNDQILGGILLLGAAGSDEVQTPLFLRRYLRSSFAWQAAKRVSERNAYMRAHHNPGDTPPISMQDAAELPCLGGSKKQEANLDLVIVRSMALWLPQRGQFATEWLPQRQRAISVRQTLSVQ